MSSTAARSRTLRATHISEAIPKRLSQKASGPTETRPRLPLRPLTPQWLAGTRIEPDASVATMPAATAALEPPLEPPGEREVSQGLRGGPQATGFVDVPIPSSSRLVLPIRTNPDWRIRSDPRARAGTAGRVAEHGHGVARTVVGRDAGRRARGGPRRDRPGLDWCAHVGAAAGGAA